jgi:crotonobetainyl-CoA:carnitine CoA-transferase CaiB-like acyl-CoA transferase
MTAVMQGIRILEVAEHTFVPAASAILADWGADVIKIEHVERGDAMRGLASTGTVDLGQGTVHVLVEHSNRGKRSLALDLAAPRGSTSSTGWPPPPTCSSPISSRRFARGFP